MKLKISLVLITLSLIFVAICYGVLNYTYSTGVRSGKLVKISEKGFLFKTYEGTLDLGSGDKLTWDFSVHDGDLGEKLVEQTGKNVRLEYRELLFKILYATKYDVKSWSFEGRSEAVTSESFCKLVNILRRSKQIVDYTKLLVKKYEPTLLDDIRACQN